MEIEISSIGDVCEFSRGLTYKKADEAEYSSNAVLRANNITLEAGKINFDDVKYISDKIEIPESKKVKKGSLLICTASGSKKHLGKIGLVDKDMDFAFGGFMGMLTPNEKIDSKYLYWLTQSKAYSEFIGGLSDGANINNLKFSQLTNFPVPIVPIPEQKRIVELLDTVFADLEQTRAKTEQNLKNARELFDSYLQQVFSQKGEGWVDGKMTDICEINTKLIDPKEDEYLNLLHIGAGNIVSNTGELIKLQTAKEEGLISGKFVFDSSMILYSKIRPYLMKVCRPEFTGLCSADIYPLSPIKEMMDKDFLFYLLLSKDFTDYAISGSGRAGMPKVNRTHLFLSLIHI